MYNNVTIRIYHKLTADDRSWVADANGSKEKNPFEQSGGEAESEIDQIGLIWRSAGQCPMSYSKY